MRITKTLMTAKQLRTSVSRSEPDPALPPLIAAMWWEAKGVWARAHQIAQEKETPESAWVHAYLHRREGDATNAAYWYRRAGRPQCQLPLEQEWNEIAVALLAKETSSP